MKHPYTLVHLRYDPFRRDQALLGVLTDSGFVESFSAQDLDGSEYLLAEAELRTLREAQGRNRPALCGPCIFETSDLSMDLPTESFVPWLKQTYRLDTGTATRSFGWALNRLKHGRHVARQNWNGKGMFLVMEHPSDLVTQPYIGIWNARGKFQPGWTASQEDLLATDWTEVKDHQDEGI